MYKGIKLYPILCLLSTSHGHVQENFLEPRNKVPRNDEDGQHFNSELVLTLSALSHAKKYHYCTKRHNYVNTRKNNKYHVRLHHNVLPLTF